MVGKEGVIPKPQGLNQCLVELGLERAQGNELSVRTLVGVVPGLTPVSPALTQLILQLACVVEHPRQGGYIGGTVGNGTVHNLALTGFLRVDIGTEEAEQQYHGATADIADQAQGGRWRATAAAAVPEHH